ncbi:DUF2333 family protein, partial [Pseudomonas syringae]
MLDWKNRAGSAGARTADTSSTKRRGYLGNLFYSRALGALILIYLLVALAVGWYWSKEPALFPVQHNAQAAAEREGKQMGVGYTTVETLKTVAGTLINKPGGHLSNGRMPPGLSRDNITRSASRLRVQGWCLD